MASRAAERKKAKPLPQANDCSICTRPYTEANWPMTLECGHVMCSDCVEQIDDECFFCRRPSTPNSGFRIYNDAEAELTAGMSSLSLDIQIIVQPMRGNSYCVAAKTTDTVASLKAKIRFYYDFKIHF